MTSEEIKTALIKIREELDKTTHSITDVEQNLLKLQSLAGLCAEIIKECEQLKLSKQREEIEKTKHLKGQPFEMTMEGLLSEEISVLNYSKRLFDCIKSKSDACRTIISLHKAEIENTLKK